MKSLSRSAARGNSNARFRHGLPGGSRRPVRHIRCDRSGRSAPLASGVLDGGDFFDIRQWRVSSCGGKKNGLTHPALALTGSHWAGYIDMGGSAKIGCFFRSPLQRTVCKVAWRVGGAPRARRGFFSLVQRRGLFSPGLMRRLRVPVSRWDRSVVGDRSVTRTSASLVPQGSEPI